MGDCKIPHCLGELPEGEPMPFRSEWEASVTFIARVIGVPPKKVSWWLSAAGVRHFHWVRKNGKGAVTFDPAATRALIERAKNGE